MIEKLKFPKETKTKKLLSTALTISTNIQDNAVEKILKMAKNNGENYAYANIIQKKNYIG